MLTTCVHITILLLLLWPPGNQFKSSHTESSIWGCLDRKRDSLKCPSTQLDRRPNRLLLFEYANCIRRRFAGPLLVRTFCGTDGFVSMKQRCDERRRWGTGQAYVIKVQCYLQKKRFVIAAQIRITDNVMHKYLPVLALKTFDGEAFQEGLFVHRVTDDYYLMQYCPGSDSPNDTSLLTNCSSGELLNGIS